MSDFDAHFAAARDVQFALAADRRLTANANLAPASRIVPQHEVDEAAARDLALRELIHLEDRPDAWAISPTGQLESRFITIGAPPVIYGLGNQAVFDSALEHPAVTITGAQRATPTGRDHARRIASECTGSGIPLFLGMSNGIEANALAAALEVPAGARGPIVLILGSSPAIAWPRNQIALYERAISEGAAVISQTPHMAPPIPASHHLRDRLRLPIVSAAIVVEATPEDTTVLTFIDAAKKLSRQLFAVPGPPEAVTSAIPNALIRDHAAQLLCHAADLPIWIVGENPTQ